jgi:hypothetical protein
LAKPPTRKLVTAEVCTLLPPGDALITYPVTGDPPLGVPRSFRTVRPLGWMSGKVK